MRKHRESPIARINPSGKRVWVARYTDPDGKRRSAGTFDLRRDAQDAIDAVHGAPARRDTVGAFFGGRRTRDRDDGSDWTDRFPRSERTDKTNRGRVRAVLNVPIEGRPFRDWPLADLRRRHALALVDHLLREQGRAATGTTNILRALSAMAEDAITDELIGVNPFRGVKVRRSDPRAQKQSRKARVLSWDQMHAFAAAAATRRRVNGHHEPVAAARYEPMLRMLADCGLRIGELFALRRELQDLKAGVFVVLGSGWEGELIESSETKEHGRVGPIPPGCLELLRAMPVRIDSPWLFPTRGGQMWRINNFYRDVWRPTREASRIECTPQDFRHSWNSNLRAAGIDPADLAEIAGHSVEVATARYTHALRRSFDAVREAIG